MLKSNLFLINQGEMHITKLSDLKWSHREALGLVAAASSHHLCGAQQSRAQDSKAQGSRAQDRTALHRTGEQSRAECSTAQRSSVQHSTALPLPSRNLVVSVPVWQPLPCESTFLTCHINVTMQSVAFCVWLCILLKLLSL